jgi:hypothetical protein
MQHLSGDKAYVSVLQIVRCVSPWLLHRLQQAAVRVEAEEPSSTQVGVCAHKIQDQRRSED